MNLNLSPLNAHAPKSESWYTRLLARVYDSITASAEDRWLGRWRKAMLADLRGTVLEVGAGTGVNFPFYAPGTHVIACEPSAAMAARARKMLASSRVKTNVTLLEAGVGAPEVAAHVPAEGFDAIVCTLVLCTIPDPAAALADFRHWLKPDGRLVLIEHVRAETQLGQGLQEAVQPLWYHLAEGCHLTRDTGALVRAAGLEPVWEERAVRGLPFLRGEYRKSG